MTRTVSTRTTWEPVVGYSRAVAAGDFIFVSGCTSVAVSYTHLTLPTICSV